MDLEKIKDAVHSTQVVEELITLSKKIFDKSSDDVKNLIELMITRSYLMGKKNIVKSFDE